MADSPRAALALLLSLSPLAAGQQPAAQPPPVPVRLVARDGGTSEGLLLDLGGVVRVRVGGQELELPAASLRGVVFLPPPGPAPAPGIDVAPRCDWRLDAPLWRVVAEAARQSGREIELAPDLGGLVRLSLQDRTWRGALEAAAGSCGGGLTEDGGVARVTSIAVAPPFRLVWPREVAPPEPLPPIEGSSSGSTAFRHLSRTQEPDGRWSALGQGGAPGPGDALATSLCVLAYLGNGHTHRFGTWKRQVNRGLTWLKAWAPGTGTDSAAPTLDRALITQAFAEAYAVSRDYTLRLYAKKSLQVLLEARAPQGGWGLAPASAPDAFSTAHAVLALEAARIAGLELPLEVMGEAGAFLQRLTDAEGHTGFRGPGQAVSLCAGDPAQAWPLPLFSAGALISRVLAGESRKSDKLLQLADRLMEALPHARRPDPAYWYLASYSLCKVGEARWLAWNKAMQEAVITLQREDPVELAGSWDPAGLWGQLAGRAGTTAVCALTLEVYYRYERAVTGEPDSPR